MYTSGSTHAERENTIIPATEPPDETEGANADSGSQPVNVRSDFCMTSQEDSAFRGIIASTDSHSATPNPNLQLPKPMCMGRPLGQEEAQTHMQSIAYPSLSKIFEELHNSASLEASPDERNLSHFLSSEHVNTEDALKILQAVTEAAYRSNDPELWGHGVRACAPKYGLVSASEVHRALAQFGLEPIRSSLEYMIENERSNVRVFTFLTELDSWRTESTCCEGANAESLVKDLSPWIQTQLCKFSRSLRTPTEEDFCALVGLGEGAFLQIVSHADVEILMNFARRIHSENPFHRCRQPGEPDELSSALLREVVSQLEITPGLMHQWHCTHPSRSSSPSSPSPSPPPPCLGPDDCKLFLSKRVLEACLDLHCYDLASKVLDKVVGTGDLVRDDAHRRATKLMLPILAFVGEHLHSEASTPMPEPIAEAVGNLQRTAIAAYVERAVADPTQVQTEDFTNLIQAAVLLPAGSDLFVSKILPAVQTLQTSERGARVVVDSLHSALNGLTPAPRPFKSTLRDVSATAAKHYAQLATIDDVDSLEDTLDCLVRTESTDAFWLLIERIVDPQLFKPTPERSPPSPPPPTPPERGGWHDGGTIVYHPAPPTYADRVLAPLVPRLRAVLVRHGQLGALGRRAFGALVRAYMRRALGPKPAADPAPRVDAIREWVARCGCRCCAAVQAFLLESPAPAMALRGIGFEARCHVELFLCQHVTAEAAAWATVRPSPQGLAVSKTALLQAPLVWAANREKAVQMMHDVSPDVEERKRIFGDEYGDFLEWTKGLSVHEAVKFGYEPPPSPHPTRHSHKRGLEGEPGPHHSKRRRITHNLDARGVI